MNGIGSVSRICPRGAAIVGIFALGTDIGLRGGARSIDCCGTPSEDEACTEEIIAVGEGSGEPDLAVADVLR